MVRNYFFRDVRPGDLPRLRVWLHTPEVVRWWGDPDQQAAMLEDDLTEPRVAIFQPRASGGAQNEAK